MLLAVLLLTVSGQSSDTITKEDTNTYKQDHSTYDLLAATKKKIGTPNNG